MLTERHNKEQDGPLTGKISAQPHTTVCIQFLDRENSDKNNTLPLGKQICFTIVKDCAEILPHWPLNSKTHSFLPAVILSSKNFMLYRCLYQGYFINLLWQFTDPLRFQYVKQRSYKFCEVTLKVSGMIFASDKCEIFPDLWFVVGLAAKDETSCVQKYCTKRVFNFIYRFFKLFYLWNLGAPSNTNKPQDSFVKMKISPFGELRTDPFRVPKV